MSVAYAAGALTLVLAMPEPDAIEHAGFAQAQGFSCLGVSPTLTGSARAAQEKGDEQPAST